MLEKLLSRKVGTHSCEKIAKMLVREGKGRKSNIVERDSSMVSQVMNIKILQAAEEEKEEEHR